MLIEALLLDEELADISSRIGISIPAKYNTT